MASIMDAQLVVERFAFKEYGQVIKVDPPMYINKGNYYLSNVRANYPVYIFDDREPADYKIRVLKIEHLGQITLNDQFQIVPTRTTYGTECLNNLKMMLEYWKQQAENIVVSASSDQLIQIESFRNHFNKIELILEYLMENDRIHKADLTRYEPKEQKLKIRRYVNLMESLGIVRYEEPYYVPANVYISTEKETKTDEELLKSLLSHIIKIRYPTLRDEFGLTILEKTVGVDNVIYLPELEMEEPVYRNKPSIADSYKRYYGKNINPMRLNQILRRLEKVGAIQRKLDNYFGVEDLREDMITKKKKLEPLTISPHIPRSLMIR